MGENRDFQEKRKDLAKLREEDLDRKFWELAERIVDPLIDLAKNHTSPSIERSVLLRMGFSSIEAKIIVEGIMERGLMGKGAGHVVYKLAQAENLEINVAGLELVNGNLWDKLDNLFKVGEKNEAQA